MSPVRGEISDRSMFLCFSLFDYYDFYIPVVDPGRPSIDMVYFYEYVPEGTRLELFRVIKPDLMEEYIGRLSHIFGQIALAILLDIVKAKQ